MDLLEFLQILFCCMFPVRRRKRSRKSRISHPVRRARRSRASAMRGPDKHRRIASLRSRANYAALRNAIVRGIYRDISRTLVAWCPHAVVSPDYVSTALHRCGDVLAYLDNWACLGTWAGTVVQYATAEEADLALREVPMVCRHIKILPLENILNLLVDCELLHGEFRRHSSRVVISGRRTPGNGGTFLLHFDLASYGEIEKMFFSYKTSPGVVCEVSYTFLTQAYLATIMLEGSCYDNVRLSAKIEETPRDEEIIEDAKKCLMFVTGSYFPR